MIACNTASSAPVFQACRCCLAWDQNTSFCSPVNTDIHDGVWRLRPPRSGTLTGGAILRPSIGEWVLGVAFVEATFIVASSCVRKHSAWSWSTTLQSVGTVAPLRYYRARNLGYVWCTASGSSIKPEGPGVQAICALPCTR